MVWRDRAIPTALKMNLAHVAQSLKAKLHSQNANVLVQIGQFTHSRRIWTLRVRLTRTYRQHAQIPKRVD